MTDPATVPAVMELRVWAWCRVAQHSDGRREQVDADGTSRPLLLALDPGAAGRLACQEPFAGA